MLVLKLFVSNLIFYLASSVYHCWAKAFLKINLTWFIWKQQEETRLVLNIYYQSLFL